MHELESLSSLREAISDKPSKHSYHAKTLTFFEKVDGHELEKKLFFAKLAVGAVFRRHGWWVYLQ